MSEPSPLAPIDDPRASLPATQAPGVDDWPASGPHQDDPSIDGDAGSVRALVVEPAPQAPGPDETPTGP